MHIEIMGQGAVSEKPEKAAPTRELHLEATAGSP